MPQFVFLPLLSSLVVFFTLPFVSSTCLNETITCGGKDLFYPFGVAGESCGDPEFQVYNCTTLSPYIVINDTNFYILNVTEYYSGGYYSRGYYSRGIAQDYFSSGVIMYLGIHIKNELDIGCFDFSILKSPFYYDIPDSDSVVIDRTKFFFVNCSQVVNNEWNSCDSWYITFLPPSSDSSCNSTSTFPNARVSWMKARFKSAATDLSNTESFVLDRKTYMRCSECWNNSATCAFNVTDYSVQCHFSEDFFPDVKKRFTGLITGLLTAGGVVTTVIFAIFLLKRRRQGFKRQKSLPHLPIFSYQQIRAATNSFSDDNKIGSGSFGAVYKGTLSDRRKVAVKRLYRQQAGTIDEFLNEVGIFCQVQHPNIVRLYGFSNPYHSSRNIFRLYGFRNPYRSSRDEFLLVFEYISNGTLADHLYGSRKAESRLTWDVRIKIAVQIAEALAFLHAMQPPLLHRDVKSSNILLDDGMEAKVADFGISREMAVEATHVTTAPRGTPGYLDPQYFEYFQLTDKSDVYSFGVVLLEIVSGLKAVDLSRTPAEHVNLVGLVKSKWVSSRWAGLEDVIDPQLREHMAMDPRVNKMLMQITLLACKCVASDKEERPSMKDAADLMQELWTKDELPESLGFPSSVTAGAVLETKPLCSATWETSCLSGR